CLELFLVLLTELLLCHDDKFSAVSELDICLCLFSRLDHLHSRSCFDRSIIHFFALESVKCTVEHLHQSLSAGIHDTCLFQHRKHLQCLRKDFLSIFHHLGEKNFKILLRLCHLLGLLGSALSHSQDRA